MAQPMNVAPAMATPTRPFAATLPARIDAVGIGADQASDDNPVERSRSSDSVV
jgi:hypothetical protein